MIVDRRFFRVIDWNLDQFLSAHPTPNNQPHSACYFLHTTITVLPESHFCVPFLFLSFHDSLRINRNRGVEFLRWCSSVSSQPLLNDYGHPCFVVSRGLRHREHCRRCGQQPCCLNALFRLCSPNRWMLECIDSPQGDHVKRIASVTSRRPWSREWGRVVRGNAGSKVEVEVEVEVDAMRRSFSASGIGVEPSTSTKYGGTGTP